MKKNYVIKKYKGNILESLKNFEKKHPDEKILEVSESNEELKIKVEAKEKDFPQGKYFKGDPNEALKNVLLKLFDAMKYSDNKNSIKKLREKWMKQLSEYRNDKVLNDIFSENDWNAQIAWIGGVDNHLAAILSSERVLGKDKFYVVLDDGRVIKNNPIAKSKWNELYPTIKNRQNPKIPEWDPK